MDREVKARQVYEKLANWKDAEGLAVDDVLKSGTRVEIVKRTQGAMEIEVDTPERFRVRIPNSVPKVMTESEMYAAVRSWVLLP